MIDAISLMHTFGSCWRITLRGIDRDFCSITLEFLPGNCKRTYSSGIGFTYESLRRYDTRQIIELLDVEAKSLRKLWEDDKRGGVDANP